MTLGEKIRTIRKQKGISQEALAAMVYTKKQTISLYEQDKLELKVSVLTRIASALKVPVTTLLEETEEERMLEDYYAKYDAIEASALIKSMRPELRKVAMVQLRALVTLE
ncbi:helix-turn-helix domain-containing protein [Butyrivibrio sp. YAB3001]|uniref:helix-turn-helix domain-containing protein n=1 Tax=Butyrivibrio sp. YAB3001 TaxID=1520812 RepID=UPI0008F65722|nr:helix-turn-helix transcriptional regulator [Butyrivibrio sp. YAB3001]SFC57182.1 Helix-turn-helix domain-containing protein [Butyrivibrio sp. YAB3001]